MDIVSDTTNSLGLANTRFRCVQVWHDSQRFARVSINGAPTWYEIREELGDDILCFIYKDDETTLENAYCALPESDDIK